MNADHLKLSIVIPVYNVEPYLATCFDSILPIKQMIECEIIVINDGSTDGSLSIIHEYKEKLNFKIINQTNKGLSSARNAGLKIARGEYVFFLDSDDFINHNNFIKIFNDGYLHQADVIMGDYYNYYSECKYSVSNNDKLDVGESPIILGNEQALLSYNKIHSVVWRSFYRRELIVGNSLWFHEGVFFEDVEWTPQVLFHSRDILYVPLAFYYYRQRVGSIVNSQYSPKKMEDAISVCNSLNQFIKGITNRQIQIILREHVFHLIFWSLIKTPQIDFYVKKDAMKLIRELKPMDKYKFIRVVYILAPSLTICTIRCMLKLRK